MVQVIFIGNSNMQRQLHNMMSASIEQQFLTVKYDKVVEEHKEGMAKKRKTALATTTASSKRRRYSRTNVAQELTVALVQNPDAIADVVESKPLVAKPSLHCRFCDKQFGRYSCKTDLENHERKHTGERPFACSHCEWRFAQKGNRDAHERIHLGMVIRRYQCDICNRRLTRPADLRKHKFRIHHIQP